MKDAGLEEKSELFQKEAMALKEYARKFGGE